MSSRHTADRAKFVFGLEMEPCPKCGGYHLGYSMPIVMQEPIIQSDSPKQILGKWARSVKGGKTPLEGTCRIMCRDCGHLGPAVDVTGRTSEDVGKDPVVSKKAKELWNNQPTTK